MSSHYISISCSTEGCEAFDTIYTGDQYLDHFHDREWEGETIYAKCKEHDGGAEK